MSDNDRTNYGFQNFGGNVTVQNLAIGDHATVNVSARQSQEIAETLGSVRKIISESGLSDEQKLEAKQVVEAIEAEAEKDEPDRNILKESVGFLGDLGKAGSSFLDMAEKLAPHLSMLISMFALT